jgi:hypothetical protein
VRHYLAPIKKQKFAPPLKSISPAVMGYIFTTHQCWKSGLHAPTAAVPNGSRCALNLDQCPDLIASARIYFLEYLPMLDRQGGKSVVWAWVACSCINGSVASAASYDAEPQTVCPSHRAKYHHLLARYLGPLKLHSYPLNSCPGAEPGTPFVHFRPLIPRLKVQCHRYQFIKTLEYDFA